MKKLCFLTLFCSILFLFACGDDDTVVQLDPIVFYDSGEYLLQATCVGDDIEFFLDVIIDTTDDSRGTFPDSDIYRVYVDYNNNKIIDANVDMLFSPLSDGRICRALLLTDNSTTACTFSDDITGETLFSTTENAGVAHTNHRFRVPKNVLSSDSEIGVVVELYNPEFGWTTLPIGGDVLGRSIRVSW